MYNEIKQNIIDNFFNKGYLYTYACSKQAIIDKIFENTIFPINYYNNDVINMNLGDKVNISFKLNWEVITSVNKLNNKETKYYKLIKIE